MRKVTLLFLIVFMVSQLSFYPVLAAGAPSLKVTVRNMSGSRTVENALVTIEDNLFASAMREMSRTDGSGVAYFERGAFKSFKIKNKNYNEAVNLPQFDPGKSPLVGNFEVKITVDAPGVRPESHVIDLPLSDDLEYFINLNMMK